MYLLENVGFVIGKRAILKNINLNIKESNFLSIVGPNGSGKSTLLKIINKNLNEYTGSIKLNNKSIEEYDAKTLALKRTVLNQSFNFSLNFKVLDIVEMGLSVHNISMKKKKEILDFIISKLNIRSFLHRDYQTLSGGQKQRVQFARVISQLFIDDVKNKFLFLDEPTLNLDIHQQYVILDLTKELVKDYGLGVCAVLHDLNQAFLYSDEIAVMKKGKLEYFGDTKRILTYEKIKNIFHIESDIIYSQRLQKNILITG